MKIIVGNKGVISTIIPDEEMPVISEGPLKGQRAEILLNPLGIIGRIIGLSIHSVHMEYTLCLNSLNCWEALKLK